MQASSNSRLADALVAWRELLGDGHVLTERSALAAAGRSTFAAESGIPAILEPADRSQLQRCVEIANRYRVPIYPISRGLNWGYGSRLPPRAGAPLLSLRRLNRILEFDESLGYVVVEPGVTFGELGQFLASHRSRLEPCRTGTSLDASLIGNALERGLASSPYEDRMEHVGGLEAVLADGRVVATGCARFRDAPARWIHRAGVGPALDGLFVQSNLGIVTRMALWLRPVPSWRQECHFSVADSAALGRLIDAQRDLRLGPGPAVSIRMANDFRNVMHGAQYPYEETRQQTPLPAAELERMLGAERAARWLGCASFDAPDLNLLDATRRWIEAALGPVTGRFQPLDPMSGDDVLAQPLRDHLECAYWRKQQPIPEQRDPDRDRCGVIWVAPVVPATGADVERATATIEEFVLTHRFEPGIALRFPAPRHVVVVSGIIYDRDSPDEDEKAMRCAIALQELLNQAGYLPYRLGIHNMTQLPSTPDHQSVLRTLKDAIDPHQVIAPGRYIR